MPLYADESVLPKSSPSLVFVILFVFAVSAVLQNLLITVLINSRTYFRNLHTSFVYHQYYAHNLKDWSQYLRLSHWLLRQLTFTSWKYSMNFNDVQFHFPHSRSRRHCLNVELGHFNRRGHEPSWSSWQKHVPHVERLEKAVVLNFAHEWSSLGLQTD